MDFNRIKDLAAKRKVTMKQVIKASGMSEAGFYRAIENNSLRVSVLEEIANILDIPVSVFFDTGEVDLTPFQKESHNVRLSAKGKNIHQSGVNTLIGQDECLKALEAARKEIDLLNRIIESKDQVIAALQR